MILSNKIHIRTSGEGGVQVVGEIEEFVVNFILPIILLTVAVGIFVFYASPMRKKLPELASQVESKTQEVTVLQAKIDQLTKLQQNKDLVIGDLVKMSWALEERDKVPELTEQVRLMSKDASVVFKSLGYENTNKGGGINVNSPSSSLTPDPELYREEKVSVGVEIPDFTSTVAFLKIAETSIRLFKVESLKVSALNQIYKADLVMVSPYLNPAFSAYSQTAAPIDLKNPSYRSFMERLDVFKNYAKGIDATLPKI